MKDSLEGLDSVHALALQQFGRVYGVQRPFREECLQDRRFLTIAGAPWEGYLTDQFANRPRIEVNKLALGANRITNEYRNNRPGISFVSKDGQDNTEIADLCTGLLRADEQSSNAEESYDNAFDEALAGGIGAWRLMAVKEDDLDDESEHQKIEFVPITDADQSVFFDPDAKKQDKSDAKWGIVITSMDRTAYIEQWGDDPSSWPSNPTNVVFEWCTPDVVYLAEYYRVEIVKEVLQVWTDVTGVESNYSDSDFENDDDLLERLTVTGSTKTGEKPIKRRRVHKYIMSGSKILEDCGFIAGPNIPIVITYGKRWYVQGIERCAGYVRTAKDAQRLFNMELSKLAELSATPSRQVPIVLPEQMAGHQAAWSEVTTKDPAYLLLNGLIDANGNTMPLTQPPYTMPTAVPPALAALMQVSQESIQEVTGSQSQGDKMVSNISGKAVELIQERIDAQAYIYMSNFSKALKRSAEIWLGMARELYVEEGRKMKMLDDDGEASQIEINKPKADIGDIGERENDLSGANFDVVAEVGPSSSSKKSSIVRAITGMMQLTQDPETLQVLTALSMMNMEGEGLREINRFYRKKLVKMGVIEPTEQEKQELAQQGKAPDPQAEYLAAASEKEIAGAEKLRADTVETIASAELKRAQTLETLGGVEEKALAMAMANSQAVQQSIEPVQQAVEPVQAMPSEPPQGDLLMPNELEQLALMGDRSAPQ